MAKKAYTLLFDGYADWELGHVLAELRRYGKVDVVTAGFTDKVFVSMGGLHVIPDITISQLDPEDVLIFIVPGGYMWEGEYPVAEVERLLHLLDKAKIPVAAICAATIALARAGLLRDRKHTSNSKDYLSRKVPGYSEDGNYVDALSTRDRSVVTASGLGSVEFTVEIFNELDLVTPEMRSIWYEAFKHGKYPEDV